ncbi:substrate-binding domain-containing protein [Brachybacterium muris]|uniref:ABC transporter substrate-binding protein n=1 Tax=Brachybacterium muris UCD-AY4 TaxID=1249481 RepID=A0A022KTL4_9MICO|nr:substrate-binding domain-containing protein [Brachybacterium muris]EYT47876.1 ABC transporter substrate-binding protein [Brachybacterium muris UCD-AY4]MCT1654772.1 substrate-binding domain-containing protein [Brachybacterium muris]
MSPVNPTRRQTLGLTAVLAGALSLAACNRGGGEAGAEGGGGGGTVMLSVSTQTNPFFVQLVDGARKAAEELGLTLEVQDASDDASTQANHLQNAITQGVACVIVNPTDSDAVSASIEALNAAEIPVIAVDRNATSGELVSYIASDNVAGGAQAAQALAEAIGDTGQILVLQGVPGASATRDRGQGFTEEIAKHGDIEVVAEQTANFDRAEGLNVATNLLQANPDVVGIFAHNDEMALGAIEALGPRAGSEVFVVGFDGTGDGLAAVEAGTMHATIAQQPGELGAQAVEQAQTVVEGGSPEAEVQVDVVVVTAENVSEYL